MKNSVYILFIIMTFSSCSTDLSDLESRLEKLETENNNHFGDKEHSDSIFPKLLSLTFEASANPLQLSSNITGEIIGDSVVECWIPNMVENKEMSPQLSFQGESVLIDGEPYTGGGKFDFKKPVCLSVIQKDIKKDYMVYVHSFTGLPIVMIETEERKEVTSKTEYLNASFKLIENVKTRGAGDVVSDSVQIKGRGRSSFSEAPKKPYRLKFFKKVSLFDEPKDRSYVMIPNYFDKTMLRNWIAYYMGHLSNLDYTPSFHFVDVFFNGRYDGTYMLGDKLNISKDRVNVGDDGFLLEVDGAVSALDGDLWFSVGPTSPFSIKDPDVIENDKDYVYIKNYITLAYKTLFSENFKDPNEGWRKYIDISSVVDWYLINEITKNGDALCFNTSCYMNLKRGEKLKMGPLWDFDVQMGNNGHPAAYPVEGYTWDIMGSPWMKRFFEDEDFVKAVKERFEYFYSKRDQIFNEINMRSEQLQRSVVENENRWGTLYIKTYGNYDIWGSYQNEVMQLKNWLYYRFEWLKTEYSSL